MSFRGIVLAEYEDQPYRLVLDMNAYAEYELATGIHYQALNEAMAQGMVSAAGARHLVRACLLRHHPQATLPSGIETFASGDAAQLEAWASKKGLNIGKPLVTELEVGIGGGIRGSHFNGVETMRVEIGADGRGVIR